jgi:hypothetical protein
MRACSEVSVRVSEYVLIVMNTMRNTTKHTLVNFIMGLLWSGCSLGSVIHAPSL